MPPERVERKLAAILAADVAGYSRLIGADEEGTLKRLKAYRKELIDPKIAEHQGRVVKVTGDGILIEFPSAVAALRCAVEVQRAMAERNASEAADSSIEFRVGLHQGDIVVEDGDILGDGVNVAARLEALAEAGGICVSQRIHEDAVGRVDVIFEDMGEQQLKNIARPVRVYRVRREGAATGETPALALPDKPSIAVLPFQNLSGDPEQEYFADGMAEDIITALSRLRWFFVIARNSSFAYKGKAIDVRQVARELGVRYVLEGSVRKAGNRLRITAQLVDAATGNHIWAERYDREIADIFAVQDEITESVVASIEPELYAAENLRIESKPPESLDAWGCVIRALWHLARLTKEDNEQARELLKRAIVMNPRYAKAHSLLAWADLNIIRLGTADPAEALPVAERHARAALASDDADPWTYFGVGYLGFCQSRYTEAIAAFQRAMELNPNFAMAHGWLGGALAYDGKPEAALDAVARAMRMSPRDPFNFYWLLFAAVAHYTAERYAEAASCTQRVVRERPNFFPARRLLAAAHVGLGALDHARGVISELLRLQPNSSIKRDAYGYVAYARRSDQERFVAALRAAGLPEA
ncbi:MAG TPA: tetratricopeptide repeat protein [Stellaceae bacterium]|nr:tetratricopeptide repeat protein [Stellaceae bacterium]